MYQISQKIPEKNVTIRIAATTFFSFFVRAVLSSLMLAVLTSSFLLSSRKGFLPASPRDFWPMSHHATSTSMRTAQIMNMLRYPLTPPLTASSVRNVVPQKDPMFTKLY